LAYDFWGEEYGALANTDLSADWYASDDGSVITYVVAKEPGWATPESVCVGSSASEVADPYSGAFYAHENVILVL
jgi:hypothetical protein